MSKQTTTTTTNIFDNINQPHEQQPSINSRDRLLRLAELSSSCGKNVKQQQQQNKKPKLRIPSLSLERNNHNSQNRNKKSTTTTNNKLADLSFTNNIEHLVNSGNSNSSGKINNNAGGERVKKKHQQNDNQDDDLEEEEEKFLNRWNSLHSSSSSRDSSQEYSIHPFKKITQTNQTTKSVLNNQHRDNDPHRDNDDGNVQQSSSSTILNTDINKYFHNESSNIIGSRIPLYNQGHQTSDDHDFISGFHPNVDNQCSNLYQKYEFCRKNLPQFSSYHHNSKDNRYDQQRRPSSLLRMQSDLQPSSLPLSSLLSSNVSAVKSNNIKYIPIQRINDGESTNIKSISTSNNQIESNFQQKSMKTSINHHSNDKISFQQQQQQPKFIVLDEENDYTNTPKKISTSTPKKDDFEHQQQQPEILFPKVDLFNCDQYPPTLSSEMINDERINGGHDDLIGQIFSLADTQKNSMLSMIMKGDNNFQNEENNDKSSSCDKLDIIQSDNRLSIIDKHHHRSENDLTMKNDLTRLAHLKEEQQPQQSDNYYYDGMIDRFRKKFSLRSQQSRISLSADNSPKHKINNMNYKIDINQNKIDFVNGGGGIEKQSKKQLERYTPSPEIQRQRRQFMSINRKSLRKISKKHGRLKRSQTQPLNDDNDDNVEKKNLLLDKDSEIFTKNNNKCLFGMNGEITIDNDDDNYKRVSNL